MRQSQLGERLRQNVLLCQLDQRADQLEKRHEQNIFEKVNKKLFCAHLHITDNNSSESRIKSRRVSFALLSFTPQSLIMLSRYFSVIALITIQKTSVE